MSSKSRGNAGRTLAIRSGRPRYLGHRGIGTLALLLGGCSLLLDPQLDERGEVEFGDRCTDDFECQSGLCESRRCGAECSATVACPEGGACGPDGQCDFLRPPPIDPVQAGFLYIGPVGDHGWTKAHDDSRAYMLEQLPDATAMFAPTVAPSDAPARIDEFVARGDNVVIGTSFDFLAAMQGAALRYPDVNFLLCSGFSSGPNLGSYFGRMYQVMYQAGRLAGRMTNTDRIGVVGPVVIPETVRHLNAFTQGVRSVNPDAHVIVRWVFAWFAPDEEAQAATDLLAEGVDVVFGNTDTTIPIETANAATTEETPIFTIGYDNPDSCTFAEETCITSAYWNWGPIVTRVVRQMNEGTWEPDALLWDQMQADPVQSTVYLAPISQRLVPSATRIEIEGLVPQLSANTDAARYLPFAGPIRDTAGAIRVPEGQLPTDDQLLRMCWFVDGVFDIGDTPGVVPTLCVGDR